MIPICHRFDGVIVSVFSSSVVDYGFQHRPPGQTKDYSFGICCFFAKHAHVRRKSTHWLTQHQGNVSE